MQICIDFDGNCRAVSEGEKERKWRLRNKNWCFDIVLQELQFGRSLAGLRIAKAIAELDETDTCEQICLALPKDVPAGQENSTAAQLLSKCLRKVQRMVLRYRLKERIARYQSFLEAIPHSVAVYAHDDVQQSNALYDVFVVGSDQVWADWLPAPALQAYSLDFVETTKKRVAYAASFANTSLSDKQKKMLAHGIKCMDYISVREKLPGIW